MLIARIIVSAALAFVATGLCGQSDSEALSRLELQRAEVALSDAIARADQVRALFAEGLTSRGELLRAESDLLRAKIDAEKAAIVATNELPTFQVLSAVKESAIDDSNTVHLVLRSLPRRYAIQEGNRQYLVSITNGESIIGEPYQYVLTVRSAGRGETHSLTFKLLKDASDVRIVILSGTRREELAVVLQTSGFGGDLRLTSVTPALEGSPGTVVEFPLRLERFNRLIRSLRFDVVGLPSGFRSSLVDGETAAAVNSLVLADGDNERKLTLKVFIPETVDAGVFEKQLSFHVSASNRGSSGDRPSMGVAALPLQLLIVGAPELRVEPDRLLVMIDSEGSLLNVSARNTGPVEAQNVSIDVVTPLGVTSSARPPVIKSLAPGEVKRVTISLQPSRDAVPGDYSIRVSARVLWRQQVIESDEQVVRASYEGRPRNRYILGSLGVLALVAGGIVLKRRGDRRRKL